MKDVTAEMERENRRAGAGRSRRKQKSARAFAGKGLVSGGIAVLTVVLAATGFMTWRKESYARGTAEQPENSGQLVTVGELQSSGTGEEKPILGGAELMMLSNQTKGQMMSFLIETKNGNLIVIDGGRWEDGDHLMEEIRRRGGRVDAWFLTHTHTDHVGALLNLLQTEAEGEDTGIEIQHIYYNFADLDWYAIHEPGDYGTAAAIIGELEKLPDRVCQIVERGQTITVDDVTVTVMNERYEPGPEQIGERDGNDAGIAYRMVVHGVSILFLGDLQKIGGDLLLEQAGAEALKSDVVQMAHHGQNGVSEAVYQAIDPEICLWPTPGWLWDNEGGRYQTPETKGWMEKLHVKRHYCIKDGDQIIR